MRPPRVTVIAMSLVMALAAGVHAQVGTWETKAPLTMGPRSTLQSEALDGLVYAIGGTAGGCPVAALSTEAYDPGSNTWTPRATLPAPAGSPGSQQRAAFATAVLGGQIYAFGGGNCGGTFFNDVQVYNPTSNAWTVRNPMPARRAHAAAAVVNGKIYLIGGYSNPSSADPMSPTWEYDPAAQTFTAQPPIPTPRIDPGVAVIDDKIYVVGGLSPTGVSLATVEVYNPAADQWTSATPLSTPRRGPAVAAIGGLLYAFGGSNGASILDVGEMYDPSLDTWVVAPSLPAGRSATGEAVLDGVLYVIGGQSGAAGNPATATNFAFTPIVDSDGDGLVDGADNCPEVVNADQVDTDGDGIGDACDADDDNDGVTDEADAFPLNPLEWTDSDHDGLGDNSDADDDNDGVADGSDAFPLDAAESVDSDGDGIGNNTDPNDDNDGAPDVSDPFPLDPLNIHPVFVVDSTLDLADAAPGNGVCATAAGVCTLRAAVQESNALADADVIAFSGGVDGRPITLTIAGTSEDAAATGDLDVIGALTITGNGVANTIVQGCDVGTNPACTGGDRLFDVQDGASLTMSGITVRNGAWGINVGIRAPWQPGYGGRAALTLTDAAVLNNPGPGINTIGDLTITNSRLAGNREHAILAGGGALRIVNSTISGNSANAGGAIFTNSGSLVVSFTITGSTFSGNSAVYDGGAISVNGGGPYRIANTTFSGNTVAGTDPVIGGGALFAAAPVELASVTFSGNQAGTIGGAIHAYGAPVTFRNTIVADSAGGNCVATRGGSLSSLGYNLVDDTSCGTGVGDVSGTAHLAPLANNGGPTLTHALLGASPAIDAGNPAGCTDTTGGVLATDQRGAGFARAIDGNADGTARCDIGAIEGVGMTADYDGDGVADVSDAFPLEAGESADADGDGTGNNADSNDDNDGLLDAGDPFPLDPLNIGPTPAYVSDSAGTIAVLDTAANTVTASISLGAPFGYAPRPLGVAVPPSGNRVYVANVGNFLRGAGFVSVIDSATNSVVGAITGTGESFPLMLCGIHGIATNREGTRLYFGHVPACGGGPGLANIVVVDAATHAVLATVPAGVGVPTGIAVNPAGTRVYMAVEFDNAVWVLDTATEAIAARIPVGPIPYGVAVNPEGTRVYVGNLDGNSVSVIDTASNAVVTTVPVGAGPSAVAVSRDGAWLYVTNTHENSVSVIETASNAVVSTIPVGVGPVGVAFSPAGTRAYVVNSGGHTAWTGRVDPRMVGPTGVSVIDTRTHTVVATVTAGDSLRAYGEFIAMGVADADLDGEPDASDAFPLDRSETTDTDGDGTGNNADTDDDGDGTDDVMDAFPLDAAESVDTDGDGTGDSADTDDDNDGIEDAIDDGTDASGRNQYRSGPDTFGSVSPNGWRVNITDLPGDEVQATLEAIPGVTGGRALITACGGAYKDIQLDRAGESVRWSCDGTGTLSLAAVVANPTVEVAKVVCGGDTCNYRIVAALAAGQSFSTGSPATAGIGNGGQIPVTILDEADVQIGSFALDAGESVNVEVVIDPNGQPHVLLQLLNDFGVVEVTVFGQTEMLTPTHSGGDFQRDTEPPAIDGLSDVTVEATSPAGAVAIFDAPVVTDDVDTMPEVTISHTSGTTFPLGETVVTVTASDDAGHSASRTFTVRVVDTTAPAISAPANLTIEATSAAGATATFAATATDIASTPVITYSHPPGGTFPLGMTTVTATAVDGNGNQASATFTVTVQDTQAPVIAGVSIDRPELWPPNHQMVAVTLSYRLSDVADAAPTCSLGVRSNEPENGTGDGDAAPDWQIVDARRLLLRAERSGQGNGRAYSIDLTCTDASGNRSNAQARVTVPKSRR